MLSIKLELTMTGSSILPIAINEISTKCGVVNQKSTYTFNESFRLTMASSFSDLYKLNFYRMQCCETDKKIFLGLV